LRCVDVRYSPCNDQGFGTKLATSRDGNPKVRIKSSKKRRPDAAVESVIPLMA